jgi:hypothetical protein
LKSNILTIWDAERQPKADGKTAKSSLKSIQKHLFGRFSPSKNRRINSALIIKMK